MSARCSAAAFPSESGAMVADGQAQEPRRLRDGLAREPSWRWQDGRGRCGARPGASSGCRLKHWYMQLASGQQGTGAPTENRRLDGSPASYIRARSAGRIQSGMAHHFETGTASASAALSPDAASLSMGKPALRAPLLPTGALARRGARSRRRPASDLARAQCALSVPRTPPAPRCAGRL